MCVCVSNVTQKDNKRMSHQYRAAVPFCLGSYVKRRCLSLSEFKIVSLHSCTSPVRSAFEMQEHPSMVCQKVTHSVWGEISPWVKNCDIIAPLEGHSGYFITSRLQWDRHGSYLSKSILKQYSHAHRPFLLSTLAKIHSSHLSSHPSSSAAYPSMVMGLGQMQPNPNPDTLKQIY